MDHNDSLPLVVIITDTHITRDNIDLVNGIFDQLLAYCVKHEIGVVIHGGDWFQDRSALSLACVLTIKRIIEKFTAADISIYSIVGNHDKVSLDDQTSYLHIFDHYSNFKLIDKSHHFAFGNVMFYFLSYYKSPEIVLPELQKLSKWAKSYRPTHTNILITHLSINGVRNNDGSLVDGDNEVAFFRNFDAVLVGHYHDAQQIGDNIFYIGSGYQRNFGEKVKDKGFTVVNSDGSFERVRTTFPAYRKVIIDAGDPAAATAHLEKYVSDKEAGKQQNVRFVFKGTQEQVDNLELGRFKEAGVDCKRESYETSVMFDNPADAEVIVYDKKNLIKGWMEYADKIGMEKPNAVSGMKLIAKQNFH